MQLSLVTEKFAKKFPVGYAQDFPNEDPFLPPINVSVVVQGFASLLPSRQLHC